MFSVSYTNTKTRVGEFFQPVQFAEYIFLNKKTLQMFFFHNWDIPCNGRFPSGKLKTKKPKININ